MDEGTKYDPRQIAATLVEALPYIQRFRGERILIKYGGSISGTAAVDPSFAKDVVLLKLVGIHPVVVHGGGKEISRWMEQLGLTPRFVNGLRYTDQGTMEITEMVLCGKINSQIVSAINAQGGRAIGLSGKDGGLFYGEKRGDGGEDLGLVGEISEIDPQVIHSLVEDGLIPVISPVSQDRAGQTLNFNADHVAAKLAGKIGALKVLFMTDVDGLKIEGSLRSRITLPDARKLLRHPDVKGGMIPKLECAIEALEGGVRNAHIINGKIQHSALLELLTDGGVGTMIAV